MVLAFCYLHFFTNLLMQTLQFHYQRYNNHLIVGDDDHNLTYGHFRLGGGKPKNHKTILCYKDRLAKLIREESKL